MEVLLPLTAMILTFGPVQIQGSFMEFSKMVMLLTKRSATEFPNYGCHCGPGGGGYPMDDTDRCCFHHKCCYEDLPHYGCHYTSLHYKSSSDWNSIICDEFLDLCERKLCMCDTFTARCFADSIKTYSAKYQGYPKNLCKGNSPKC